MVEGAWSPTPGARKRGEGETELQNVTDMADICVNLLEGWGKMQRKPCAVFFWGKLFQPLSGFVFKPTLCDRMFSLFSFPERAIKSEFHLI